MDQKKAAAKKVQGRPAGSADGQGVFLVGLAIGIASLIKLPVFVISLLPGVATAGAHRLSSISQRAP